MIILLSQVPPEGLVLAETIGPDVLGDLGEGVVAGDGVRITGTAGSEGDGLRVRGVVEGVLEVVCGRCLNAFSMPVSAPLDVLFDRIMPDGEEIELGAGDMVVCHLEGDRVDLAEVAREQVLLELPMSPVCDEGCKGICPQCGEDLNRGACGCASQVTDPRLAVLKKLLEG
ncbi:MAG: DUF177 domain-containing protein [Nitrospirota bacterium]|nr:DUF177 domain-containing protein [Nitrospirota bacterium]